MASVTVGETVNVPVDVMENVTVGVTANVSNDGTTDKSPKKDKNTCFGRRYRNTLNTNTLSIMTTIAPFTILTTSHIVQSHRH